MKRTVPTSTLPRRTGRRTGVAAALAAFALALVGCTTAPPRVADDSSVSGRLSVKVDAAAGQPARSVSAGFDLSGSPRAGRLQLSSPLGTVLAQAEWMEAGARLTTSDGEKVYEDLDVLTRDMLGEALPVGALFDWLRGRPWAGAPAHPTTPPAEPGFEQLGWTVQLGRFDEGWVVATRAAPPQVTVRARVDR